MKGQQCIGFSLKRSLVLFFLTPAAGGGSIHATSKPLTGEDRTSVRRQDELALAPVSGYHQGRNTSLAGEDRKSMRRQDFEIRWCQDLLKAGPGYLHSKRVGTDTGTGTHHWQGKTASPCDIKTSRCGTRELQDIFEARARYLNMRPRRTGPRTRMQQNHWQGKTVSPCDVKTPRYDGVKIYSRLGQDTSIRHELALTPGPGHITGRGRP